ncbi:zonular occludens toxin domain-containing protein [Aeromonas sp. R9-1]|uniref:zonular occludens toxin domain-containing protein n=1 Tax=Aeromonas sp. R9-1 TaxID=3138478 RepID=UPI0034A5C959
MKAPYFVTGPVGAGKTVLLVRLIAGYLNDGRPVATNIDVYPEEMPLNEVGRKTPIIRLPDEPRVQDLQNLGYAYQRDESPNYLYQNSSERITKYNESRNGMLALDETAFFMNSRDWNNPERKQLIRWLRLVRKRGWNCFLAVQDIDSIDKQIMKALCRTIVWCYSTDTLLGIKAGAKGLFLYPFIAAIRFFIRFGLRVPRVHIADYYLGKSISSGQSSGRQYAWGHWLYKAYDTSQEFTDGTEDLMTPVRDDKGRILCTLRLPGKSPREEYISRDAAAQIPEATPHLEIHTVDFRACYTILPAEYMHRWYPPKSQKQSQKQSKPLKPALPACPIWARPLVAVASWVSRRQNVPLVVVLMRWGMLKAPHRHPHIRHLFQLRRYGLRTRLDYLGRTYLPVSK